MKIFTKAVSSNLKEGEITGQMSPLWRLHFLKNQISSYPIEWQSVSVNLGVGSLKVSYSWHGPHEELPVATQLRCVECRQDGSAGIQVLTTKSSNLSLIPGLM